jgi:hypothetical protein
MGDFVFNPRQTPRAAIGCDARVALTDGRFFTGVTVDYGPQGCQLVSPTPLQREQRIFVELKGAGVPEPVWFSGRVAWAAEGPPFRAGIHFDAGSRPDARGFFFKLADAHPDATGTSGAPLQIAVDALLTPSAQAADEALHPTEAEVMRALGSGLRVSELRERLGDRWEPCLNALFSLLARHALEARTQGGADRAS